MKYSALILSSLLFFSACKPDEDEPILASDPNQYAGIEEALIIDPNNLPNYENQSFPTYYDNAVFNRFDNTPVDNQITNEGATLGRVLFYDVNLSRNKTKSCSSCHASADAFSDADEFSTGFEGGQTDVHSMRLANARFYEAGSFFWDKRAATIEFQTTQPIQNELEMGFDSQHGGMATVVARLDSLDYYPELFELAFGDETITEERMQFALAQFIRSMISVNSAFDDGYAQVYDPNANNNNIGAPFPNYTAEENQGKMLFLAPPNLGGGGCAGCHLPPTFSLDGAVLSNGLDAGETTIFKSPSLKTIKEGQHFMHDGRFTTLAEVVEHYNSGVQAGPALDPKLRPGGQLIALNFNQTQIDALVAFLETLEDPVLLADEKFANPFR